MAQKRNLVPLEIQSPVGGLNDTGNITELDLLEARVCQNVDFGANTIANRRGQFRIGNRVAPAAAAAERVAFWGFQFVLASGSSELLALFGTRLYKLDTGSNTWLGAISGLNPGTAADVFGGGNRKGSHVQWNDKIYYCDGDVAKRYTAGAPGQILPWSWSGGSLAAGSWIANIGVGALSTGDYTWVYTLYDPLTDEETLPSAVSATQAVVALQKWSISIPADADWLANYSRIRLYRTFVGGAGAWYREKEIALGTHNLAAFALVYNAAGIPAEQAMFLSVADDELGSEVEYDNDPAPVFTYVTLHQQRVVGAGILASPAEVRWSKQNHPFSVPVLNSTYCNRDDGHPIRAIRNTYGNVFALKRGGPNFKLTMHPQAGYVPTELPAQHGCESHHSVISDENTLRWIDRDGIVQFNGQQTVNMSDEKIRATFAAIAIDAIGYLADCVGIHWSQADRPLAHWFFSTTATPSPAYDTQLTFNTKTGAWTTAKFDRAQGTRIAFKYRDPTTFQESLYVLDGNGYCRRLRTNTSNVEVYQDDVNDANAALAIDFKWYSGWIGSHVEHGILRYIDIVYEISPTGKTAGAVTVNVWINDDLSAVHKTKTFALYDTGPKTKTFTLDLPGAYARSFSIGIEHATVGGAVSIPKIIAYAVPIGRRLVGAA